MAEIQDFADAQARLKRHYPGLLPTVAQDYAKIAVFLSNKPVFEAALDDLSVRLWELYRRKSRSPDALQARVRDGAERNKFTGALRMEALSHGFGMDEHNTIDTTRVVLVGAISSEAYLERIRRGLFFKDMMDLKHGEHSHTLQWLAIARSKAAIGLVNGPAWLYKTIYAAQPKGDIIVPGIKLKPKQKDVTQDKRSGVSLWSWLLDCFPQSAAAGGVLPAGESIFSNTYRCPQIVNQYLMDKSDEAHFLSLYLRYRYQKRNWFRPNETGYKAISGGATSKNHGEHKQGTVKDNKAIDSGGFERNGKRPDYTPQELSLRKWKEVSCHGQPGMMSDPGV